MIRQIIVLLCLALFLPVQDGYGQDTTVQWEQTATITAVIAKEHILEVLHDSLVARVKRHDFEPRRDPTSTPISASQFEENLRDSTGWSVDDASHARIAYQFQQTGEGFKHKIIGIQLYVQEPGSDDSEDSETPILYIDPNTEWARSFMSSGPPPSKAILRNSDCVMIQSFGEQIAFVKLVRSQDARFIALDGNDVTGGHMNAKRAFVNKMARLYYSSR